eukprot:m.63578 g.63578  ORF g.63578 m.63578 type:complete len:278 (-) comp23305_c0_seq1:44-877(-)
MANLPILIEPEDLARLLPLDDHDVLIIDQCKAETFIQNHIPGSIHLDYKRLQFGQVPTPGALPSVTKLEQVFSELGLTPTTHVICSDGEGGGWAGRLIWVLDCIGHTKYSYLNGGIIAWLEAGLPTESGEVIKPSSTNFRIGSIQPQWSFTKEEMLDNIGKPDFAIWDARSAAEYTGERVISKRGGHIPGAVNYEWTRGMDKARGLRMNDLDTFRAVLSDLGIGDSKTIATHCHTHHRSGFTYVVGKLLGLDIRGYAGSWSEWGNDDDMPITIGDQP